MTTPQINYFVEPLAGVKIRHPLLATQRSSQNLRLESCEVQVQGEWKKASNRFWGSVLSYFGFSPSIFKYFNHQEVFDRICERNPKVELRFCLEADRTLLGVSGVKKSFTSTDDVKAILHEHQARKTSYSPGVVSCTLVPRANDSEFPIGADGFRNEFILDVPIGGYGGPKTYLSLIRLVCSNGLVARSKAFRTDLTIGKDPVYDIVRALDSMNNEDGYDAFKKRIEASQHAPASLYECSTLFKIIHSLPERKDPMLTYEKAVGDIHGLYGMANLNGLAEKRLRLLPAKCNVYDLLNVASEISTHQVTGKQSMTLEGWMGKLLTEEFDLEKVDTKARDFPDFFGKARSSEVHGFLESEDDIITN